jgi:small-conductance mechanosensitive channel
MTASDFARSLRRASTIVLVLLILLISRGARADAQPEVLPDRSTPRATVEGFLRATAAGDTTRAAAYLDLGAMPRARRGRDGPEHARELGLLLRWNLVLDTKDLSEDPEGDPADGPGSDLVGALELGDEPVPVALTRVKQPDGSQVWLFSKTTVSTVPALYAAYGRLWLGDRLPPSLTRVTFLDVAAWQWIGLALALGASYAIGFAAGSIVLAIARFLARRSKATWDDEVVQAARGPVRLGLGLAAFSALYPWLKLAASAEVVLGGVRNGVVLVAAAWLAMKGVDLAARSFDRRLPEDTAGELASRGIRTQIAVARRALKGLVALIACAAVLTQFEVVRTVGTSLLASAGIAGVVLGIAAQKTLGGVLAGIQVSVAQPIRIGDAVLIEGDLGTIEEINFTYVSVRLWDERRLIVPTGRFLEQPFQNWTRMGSAIQGTLFLPADFAIPVERVRAELERLCEGHPLWDGRVCSLQVTDATEGAMMLRVVVSASDHAKNFDLRCDLREKLVRFLRELDGGAYLPQRRVALPSAPPRDPPPAAR